MQGRNNARNIVPGNAVDGFGSDQLYQGVVFVETNCPKGHEAAQLDCPGALWLCVGTRRSHAENPGDCRDRKMIQITPAEVVFDHLSGFTRWRGSFYICE
jgi:hypothetical protein